MTTLREASAAVVEAWDAREYLAPHIERLRKVLSAMDKKTEQTLAKVAGPEFWRRADPRQIQDELEAFDEERGRD